MTNTAPREKRLADEASRWRKSLREAQAVIAEQNRVLLWVFLAERLADPRDFTDRVAIEHVVDRAGRIVWERVDTLVEDLIHARPHLAATPGATPPFREGMSAIEWLTNGTNRSATTVPDHGAQGATRDRPGAGATAESVWRSP